MRFTGGDAKRHNSKIVEDAGLRRSRVNFDCGGDYISAPRPKCNRKPAGQ